ncbi:calmodulin-dependent protein kinase [Gigaspora margarita]|uniref:Calmodulin-dependent protein kinase n=1 Tax=Gigaspora margarita TaxID=4874 RepID=A0A8H4AQ05_GIGMA|nr:calmodulin-dependent protein kinase [Gigaspora margarita]
MLNNLTMDHHENPYNSSCIIQITDSFKQIDLKDKKSLDFFNEIVKELYNLYNEERSKGQDTEQIINELNQFLVKKKQNTDNIIKWCLENQFNLMAQIILAGCYRFGKWIEKDEHKAFIYYQMSADLGSAEGTFCVGICYEDGIGVNKDENMAFIYYQKAANMSHASGINNVGCCYDLGIGIEKDECKAFICYQKSADMGHGGGTYNVGRCYEKGIGVEKDEHKAFVYYQKSAGMGHISGIFIIGHCYLHGIGVKQDEYKAFTYYKKSAEMVLEGR